MKRKNRSSGFHANFWESKYGAAIFLLILFLSSCDFGKIKNVYSETATDSVDVSDSILNGIQSSLKKGNKEITIKKITGRVYEFEYFPSKYFVSVSVESESDPGMDSEYISGLLQQFLPCIGGTVDLEKSFEGNWNRSGYTFEYGGACQCWIEFEKESEKRKTDGQRVTPVPYSREWCQKSY